ncbi:MAG: HPP family protein [Acidobacteriota bacterium]
MLGSGPSPPRVSWAEIARSWLGAFLGLAVLGLVHDVTVNLVDAALLFGPFGASAVLLFAAPRSPLAQPRNLIGGHVLSALVGVALARWMPGLMCPQWLVAATAVATAIAVMHAAKALHPPGGATALVAVIGGAPVTGLGFLYALYPVAAGACLLLAVALLANNAMPGRRYPEYWW